MAIRANIIEGDERIANAVTFGQQDRRNIERSYDRLRDVSRYVRSGIADRLDRVKESIDLYQRDDIRHSLRRANKLRDDRYRNNVVSYLETPNDFANAPDVMRRVILAVPCVRSLFEQRRIDAWGAEPGGFEDMLPFGETDPIWTAINNGVVSNEADETGLHYSEYIYGADIGPEGDNWSMGEQVDALATAQRITEYIETGLDVTSVDCVKIT